IDVVGVGIAWCQYAGALQKSRDIAVVSDGSEDGGRIFGCRAPLTDAHIVENGGAAANYRLPLAKWIVGKSETRSIEHRLLINKAPGIIARTGKNATRRGVSNSRHKEADIGRRQELAGERVFGDARFALQGWYIKRRSLTCVVLSQCKNRLLPGIIR